MLKRLYIQNVALISELSIDLSKGLCIITGETGAGKSILIDSINLVLGERAGKELIKSGEQRARVEAEFDISCNHAVKSILDAEGIELDDEIITVSRELSLPKNDTSAIKSVCRINGTMVSLGTLKSITDLMVDGHGQHEHQSLLSQSRHMGFLDNFAGEKVKPVLTRVKEIYKEYHDIKNRMNVGFASEQEREQKVDILTYQINEIESVSPSEGEDTALEAERKLLASSEQIMQALYSASELLCGSEGGALIGVKSACNELYPISDLSKEYAQLADTLSDAYYALEEVAYSVRNTASAFTFDAQRLDEVESRLSAISTLKRKYGNSLDSVLAFLQNAKDELDDIVSGEQKRAQQKIKLDKLERDYAQEAHKLSELRKEAASEFSSRVMAQLAELNLSKSKFTVNISDLPGKIPSASGTDHIEFMFSANPGEPEKPLRKVASGGEISRIMLALKSVLSGYEDIGTMIFDEIDTGISGNTATVVGSKMHKLADERQILAITHLPQIAAFADEHYLVEKVQTESSTTSILRRLSPDERAYEVARIMGGSDSSLAVQHAVELIQNAKKQN